MDFAIGYWQVAMIPEDSEKNVHHPLGIIQVDCHAIWLVQCTSFNENDGADLSRHRVEQMSCVPG